MKKSKNILDFSWEELPLWLQWGIVGGISGISFVLIFFIALLSNFAIMKENIIRQGITQTLIAFSTGFTYAALSAVLVDKLNLYKKPQKIKRSIFFDKGRVKEESEELSLGLGRLDLPSKK